MKNEVENILKGTPEKDFDIFRASLYLNGAMAKSQTKSCREAIDDSTYAMKLNKEPQFQEYCIEMRANCLMERQKYKEAVPDLKALWIAEMQRQDPKKTAKRKEKLRKAEQANLLSKYKKENPETFKTTKESFKEIGTLTVNLFL